MARLRAAKAELPGVLKEEDAGQLDRFLEDATLPAAICHFRVLDRDFVLARDEDSLDALTEADRSLPIMHVGRRRKR